MFGNILNFVNPIAKDNRMTVEKYMTELDFFYKDGILDRGEYELLKIKATAELRSPGE